MDEGLAGVVTVFYAEGAGGGGVSASAVARLVGGQEEGRMGGNGMKNLPFPLNAYSPHPQPAISLHSSSS